MGIKKGTELFSKSSSIDTSLRVQREKIIKEKNESSDYRPVVAVDISVWVYKSLSNPRLNSKVSSEYHSIPRVPVTSVATSCIKRAKIYTRNKYDVIYVLDGTSHPLKDEEHALRHDSKKEDTIECQTKLDDAYKNEDKYTVEG